MVRKVIISAELIDFRDRSRPRTRPAPRRVPKARPSRDSIGQ